MASGEFIGKRDDSGFRVGIVAFILILAACLCIFVPVVLVLCALLGGGSIWLIFSRPVSVLGAVLAIMPFHFLPILLGQFFGVPHITLVSACSKEVPLFLLLYVLWRQNGFRVAPPDLFLLACVALAVLRTGLGGDRAGLWLDFEFILAYALGRVTILSRRQEQLWAKRAVWIASIVSLLGLIEVFLVGDSPRRLLYFAVTGDKELPGSFSATGFAGLREASTMIGPPSLGALCMVALIVWWVYMRNPVPAAIATAGLVSALTRSAWIGAAAGMLILAYRLGQERRLLAYSSIVVVAFIASIPVLGIRDFLSFNRSGLDESASAHEESELRGMRYVADHPFGTGAGSVGPVALAKADNAVVTENTYLAIAAEYGFPVSLCFLGFLYSGLRLSWTTQSQLAHLSVGILVAFSLMMTVLLVHEDFRLGCWVWFPVGLFIRARGADEESRVQNRWAKAPRVRSQNE